MNIYDTVVLVIVLLIFSRFFGGGGGFCGRPMERREDVEDLKREIKALRDEIRELKNKGGKGKENEDKRIYGLIHAALK